MSQTLRASRWRLPYGVLILTGVLFAAGVGLRVLAFTRRGAFWGDEAALGINIVERGFAQLGRPFLHAQVAPYLYMVGEKLVTLVFGAGEAQLRALSLLAGIALLPALYGFAKRLGTAGAELIVLATAATTPWLVYYSTELKPYSSDALISTLLLWSCFEVLAQPAVSLLRCRAFWVLTVAGIVSPWLALPSVFILAGCGVALAAERFRSGATSQERRSDFAVLAAVGGCWVASFAVHYLRFVQQTPEDAGIMLRYWAERDGFPTESLLALTTWHWYLAKFCYLIAALVLNVHYGQRYLGACLWLIGLWTLWQYRPSSALVFVCPVLGLFVAASLRLYAVSDRLALFLVPVMSIPCALGAVSLTRLARARIGSTAPFALVAALLLVSIQHLGSVLSGMDRPRVASDIRSLVSQLHVSIAPNDRVVVDQRVAWAYEYYAHRLGLYAPILVINPLDDEITSLRSQLMASAWPSRIWALLPTGGADAATNLDAGAYAVIERAEQRALETLDRLGSQRESYDGADARIYLYVLPAHVRTASSP